MGSSPFAGSATSAAAPREDSKKPILWDDKSSMITAESFLPPVAPNPKPWHRVAVPATNPRLGERKIWKRFGLLNPNSTATTPAYNAALAELQSQGHGARKRARAVGFVSAWGDASWDVARMRNAPDGKWDLVEARVSVTTAREAGNKSPVVYKTKRGSFEEQQLTWIPRKRHNTRWPIEPPKKTAPMLAELQPLVEFEVPTADLETKSEETVVQPVDDKKKRRRSTRRLSRRISLAPIEETSDEPAAVGSPVKAVPYYSSPLKSSSRNHLSPTKVSMSPAKEFTISATPSKVMLGRPDFRIASPVKSPTKGVNLASIAESETESVELPVSEKKQFLGAPCLMPPVLFDQPQPEVTNEPKYETRRRVSLQNARRSARRSSGVERLLNFETHKAPNRRHSFMPQDTAPSNIKGRRHTLDVFNVGVDQVTLEVTSPEDKEQETKPLDQPKITSPSLAQDVAVDIDVRTNLDIFGNSPVMPSSSPKISASIAEKMASSPIKTTPATFSSEEPATFNSESVGDFSTPDALGISHATPGKRAAVKQAATTTLNISPQQRNNVSTQKEVSGTETIENSLDTSAPSITSPTPDERVDCQISTCKEETTTMGENTPELASSAKDTNSTSSPADVATTQNGEDFATSSETKTVVAPALTDDDDSNSEADDTMSDISPGEDISTALRVDAYEPTVAMDLDRGDVTREVDDVQMTDGTEASNESLVVTLKYDADSEMAVSVCKGEQLEAILPGTPPQELKTSSGSSNVAPLHGEAILETPPGESPGFKPINGRQRSVSKSPSPVDEVVEQQEEDDDIDMVIGESDHGLDDDVTMTVELEVEAPIEESTRLSLHEDSETEMLRKFVTRVKADKDAKAAAAARAKLRPKRRSGSTGSTTSATGSPISKMDSLTASPAQRRPLGEKDLNQSPSPSKKRRLREKGGDVEFTKENDRLGKPALDDTTPPQPKRRRKRMEAETDSVFNPEMDLTQDLTEKGTVRRSTRTRQTRLPLKPAPSSANGAVSLIPVRLPGSSGMMQELEVGSVSGLNLSSRHRSEEKDLATVTRVNTRKNKGSSVPPRAVLAMQMDDPGWKMREVKAIHDAREARAASTGDEDDEGRVTRDRKGVRWAEVLVRVQGEDGEEVAVTKMVPTTKVDELEIDLDSVKIPEPQLSEPPAIVEEKEPVAEPVNEVEKAEKKPPVRRTRASKLQPPKAVTKASSIPARPTTPAPGAQPKSAAKTPAKTAGTVPGSMARMATRRTKVANLGMGVNGTPAPKRRTRA